MYCITFASVHSNHFYSRQHVHHKRQFSSFMRRSPTEMLPSIIPGFILHFEKHPTHMHSRLYIHTYIYNNVIRAHRVVVILMRVSMNRSCHGVGSKVRSLRWTASYYFISFNAVLLIWGRITYPAHGCPTYKSLDSEGEENPNFEEKTCTNGDRLYP